MGKGDKKTKRGKIIIGSYGVRRMRKKSQTSVINAVEKQEPETMEQPARAKTLKTPSAKKKKAE